MPRILYTQYNQHYIYCTAHNSTKSALTIRAVVIITTLLGSENRLQYIRKDWLSSQLKVPENNPNISVSDYRHCVEIVTWKAPRQPPYILTCRSILPADHRSHFSYLLPHHFYLLRVYIEPLELHLQSSCSCISSHCKAHNKTTPPCLPDGLLGGPSNLFRVQLLISTTIP